LQLISSCFATLDPHSEAPEAETDHRSPRPLQRVR